MAFGEIVEGAPQVLVFDGLAGAGLPAVALPLVDPAVDAVFQVGRVGINRRRRALAQRLQRLDHPKIVALRDFDDTGKRLFLVMDYAKGESLAERLSLELRRLDEDVDRERAVVGNGGASGADFANYMKAVQMRREHLTESREQVERQIAAASKEIAESYRDLIVRVAGYSDYFCDLSLELQEEIIARTEHGEF